MLLTKEVLTELSELGLNKYESKVYPTLMFKLQIKTKQKVKILNLKYINLKGCVWFVTETKKEGVVSYEIN